MVAFLFFFLPLISSGQSFSFNCSRDTILPGCPPAQCFTLTGIIPDIRRQSTTYTLSPTNSYPSSNCFPVYLQPNDPAGTPGNITVDDTYSSVINIGFPFPFYGTVYNSLVASTNGYLSFDVSNAGGFASWSIGSDLPSSAYDRAMIMGPNHDLNPNVPQPTQRIQYQVWGTAPHRRWILSYYRVPLFGSACTGLIENTHQIILYESTGIIEVNVFSKQICTGWNSGRGILGIQDWNMTQGMMAPGRAGMANPPWGSVGMNESWRFVPSAGTPLFKRVELLDLGGNILATGTTAPHSTGKLLASFPNICPPTGAITPYIIRSVYEKFDDPAVEIFGTDTIRANRSASLAATPVTTSASCGVSNGTINVTNVTGGTPPYEYSLDNITWQSSPTFSSLAAGTYTVYIRDANNICNSSYSVTVGLIGNLSAVTSFTATSCAGVSNGTITITSTNGLAPYQFSLDGGAFVPGALPFTFTNLAAGNHTVVVRDVNNCVTNTISINVTSGTGVNGSTSFTPTSCAGATNGTITVTASGGVPPYTYQLGANPPQASNVFTGLASGTYTITIRDNVGCTRVVTRTVTNGSSITASNSATGTTCAGASNGSVTITPTNGTGPYTFTLDGTIIQTGATSTTFTGLTAGVHTVVIRDNPSGCLSNTLNITIPAGPALAAAASPSSTTCSGASNGTVTITPTNGTGPYTFVLDGTVTQTGATSTTFNNLATGSHTVVVTDNSTGCVSNTINFTINAGPVLAATVSPAATTCSGASNGTITVTPTNGTGPYSFSLDGGAFIPGAAPYTFTNLSAGSHTVQVTDIPTGCVSTLYTGIVAAGPVLTTTASKTDVLCNGGASGTITVLQPVAGTAPYEYSLDNVNWQSSPVFNGLIAGTYTVYYREANGCANNLTITINEPTAMSSVEATTAAICNGDPNGTITVTASGGVTPYQFSIDGGTTWQPGNVFTVPAGNYTIQIQDGNGCILTRNAIVTEPALLTASSSNINASCDGGNDGVITVSAAGGNSSYQYSLDGANFQSSNLFNVAPGNYTVTVKDNLGCTTSFNTTVGLSNNLNFTPQTDPTICEGSTTQLNLVSNATQYLWSPATALSNTTIANPVANPVVTTQYVVTATLGRCSANDTVVVNVNPAPTPNAGPDGYICYGQTYQLQASGGVQYQWTPSTNLSNTNIANPISTPVKDITYTVSIIADANGCPSLTTDDVTIDVTPPIKINTFPYDTIGYPGDQIQLLAIPSDTDANQFLWTPSTGLSDVRVNNPVVTIGQIGDDRVYQVTATTQGGCKGEGYVRVRVYKGPDIYVATGFTPNGDGRNDRLTPFPVGIKSLNYFRVYNRWGQLLFSTTRLHEGWDGKLNGKEQPSGTYVWMIQAVTDDNRVINKKGTVTIIR